MEKLMHACSMHTYIHIVRSCNHYALFVIIAQIQGVTKWNTYIRSYLIRRFFTTYEHLVFRSCTSAYVEYVNREYVLQCTLKIIPRTYLEILKQHTQQHTS